MLYIIGFTASLSAPLSPSTLIPYAFHSNLPLVLLPALVRSVFPSQCNPRETESSAGNSEGHSRLCKDKAEAECMPARSTSGCPYGVCPNYWCRFVRSRNYYVHVIVMNHSWHLVS